MKGLIAAAGLSTRLQDLGERRNKVLLDLGGESILSTILTHFEHQRYCRLLSGSEELTCCGRYVRGPCLPQGSGDAAVPFDRGGR